jgi:hypothetical protein
MSTRIANKKIIISPLTREKLTLYTEKAEVLPNNCLLTPDQFIAYMQSQ